MGSFMCQMTTRLFHCDSVLQGWVVVVLCSNFTINMFDYFLREWADCEVGETSEYFPVVGWKKLRGLAKSVLFHMGVFASHLRRCSCIWFSS
eukprot:UN05865